MNKSVYSILDTIAKVYAPPFLAFNDQHAMRILEELASDPSSQIHKWPVAFQLFRIGEFSETAGCIIPEDPTNICNATSVMINGEQV